MKTLFAFAALVGITSLSSGQGFVSFNNNSGTRISTNNTANTATVPMGADPIGTWYYALFAAPSTQNAIATNSDPTLSGWTYVAIATNVALAGRLSGNNADSAQAVNTPGFAAGTTADFAIAGWSANIGNTWAAAQGFFNNGDHAGGSQASVSGYFAIAPTVANDVILAPAFGIYSSLFSANVSAGLIGGFTLQYFPAAAPSAPEPGASALVGLGAAGLFILRRRKTSVATLPNHTADNAGRHRWN